MPDEVRAKNQVDLCRRTLIKSQEWEAPDASVGIGTGESANRRLG